MNRVCVYACRLRSSPMTMTMTYNVIFPLKEHQIHLHCSPAPDIVHFQAQHKCKKQRGHGPRPRHLLPPKRIKQPLLLLGLERLGRLEHAPVGQQEMRVRHEGSVRGPRRH